MRPANWTAHALERPSQRYAGHVFDPTEVAGVHDRIAAQVGSILESRVYGNSVRLEVRMTDIEGTPVLVQMAYNVAGQKIMTVLYPEWATTALPVI